MESLLPLVIQLVSGAVGGNVAGKVLPNMNLGTLGNSIAGIVGGGLGGQILSTLLNTSVASNAGALDICTIIQSVASGGVGGGVLLAVVSIVRKVLGK